MPLVSHPAKTPLLSHTAVVSYKADKPNHSRGINPAMATDSRRTRRGSRFPRQMETLNLPRTNQTRGLLVSRQEAPKPQKKNVVRPCPLLELALPLLLTLHSRCVLLVLCHMHAVYTCCVSQQQLVLDCMLCPQGLLCLRLTLSRCRQHAVCKVVVVVARVMKEMVCVRGCDVECCGV